MKDETQAYHLVKSLKMHKRHPEYELVLPFIFLKKSYFKVMKKDDILLIGLDSLEMFLCQKEHLCAKVQLLHTKNYTKIRIFDNEIEQEKIKEHKKFQAIKCSFGLFQSRNLEINHKIDVSSASFETVTLWDKDKKIAEAKLINVDNEIALQMIEIIDNKYTMVN